jgi:hypothetical protein
MTQFKLLRSRRVTAVSPVVVWRRLNCEKIKPGTNPRVQAVAVIKVLSRVARWLIFKRKIPVWVNFGVPYIGKC